jgi:uncharacterized protein (TIGR03118 family)
MTIAGNFGDGRINAFDLSTGALAGQLRGSDGNPLSIDGLWALTIGNDGQAGSSDTIYFTAGPNDESDGLFGVIENPEPGTLMMLATSTLGFCGLRRWRRNSRA